jgi:hypothetical protein
MRQLRNTVCLEGSTCGCSYTGSCIGGCARGELTYSREIWPLETRVLAEVVGAQDNVELAVSIA